MSIGKVILVVLATVVIFSTGLITGIVLVKQVGPKPPERPAVVPPPVEGRAWPQFLYRIQGDLDLTPEQHERIETILRESQQRMRGSAGSEFRKVREQIQAELTPPQKEKFERMVKQRQRRMQELMSQARSNSAISPDGPRRPFNARPPETPQ